MVQRSGILNISTLNGSYRISGMMVVKSALVNLLSKNLYYVM